MVVTVFPLVVIVLASGRTARILALELALLELLELEMPVEVPVAVAAVAVLEYDASAPRDCEYSSLSINLVLTYSSSMWCRMR